MKLYGSLQTVDMEGKLSVKFTMLAILGGFHLVLQKHSAVQYNFWPVL